MGYYRWEFDEDERRRQEAKDKRADTDSGGGSFGKS